MENSVFSDDGQFILAKTEVIHKVIHRGPGVRNYLKMLTVKYRNHGEPGPVNGDMFAWGASHEQLMAHVQQANAALIIAEPAFTWTFTYPTDPVEVYWMLDKLNFGRILNGGAAADNAQYFWNNTRLNVAPSEAVYIDQTHTKAQGSPRSSFPTNLGTDGQRLRKGQTQSAGAALNYIGKLFFLTSNLAFERLWNDLKAGKISSREALTRANEIVRAA